MARIGVFGGTFDPIHIGHLLCAEQAREAVGLKKVLFVPVSVPAASKLPPIASAEDRMAMCASAIADNQYFELSDVDVVRGGITYTVDTLLDVRRTLSDDDELFFITGSDAAKSLPAWYRPRTLASLAHFVVVGRPGSLLDEAQCLELAGHGFDIIQVDAVCADISSTAIRRLLSAGKSARYLCPREVCAYIEERGLYLKGTE